jgi:hypothetical protein
MNHSIEADFQRELAEIEAEGLGWTPLEPGVYLHVGDESAAEVVITGQATADMAGMNVLWVV